MATLTDAQLEFLRKMDVPLSRVFNATGMMVKDYKTVMSDLGLWVAYGVTRCDLKNHTLRVRSGHCVQCRPATLAYLKRHDENAEIYVAWSNRGQLSKVGLAKNTFERIPHLNSYSYGGQTDWQAVFKIQCARAGKVESAAHQLLSRFAHDATYLNSGNSIQCRELFNCTQQVAIDAVKAAAKSIHPNHALSATNLVNSVTPNPEPRQDKNSPANVTGTKGNSMQPQSKETVAGLAAELKMPATILIDQFCKAGVEKNATYDPVSENDKSRLLDYLRRSHSNVPAAMMPVQKKRIFVRKSIEPQSNTNAEVLAQFEKGLRKVLQEIATARVVQHGEKSSAQVKSRKVQGTPCRKCGEPRNDKGQCRNGCETFTAAPSSGTELLFDGCYQSSNQSTIETENLPYRKNIRSMSQEGLIPTKTFPPRSPDFIKKKAEELGNRHCVFRLNSC